MSDNRETELPVWLLTEQLEKCEVKNNHGGQRETGCQEEGK